VDISPLETIERLRSAIAQQEPIDSETTDFFYNADFENFTFLIQTAYVKRFKGKVLIPERNISYWRAFDPVSMDQTPIFHGIILATGYGDESIITGHFGGGTPVYLAGIAILMVILVLLMNGEMQFIITIAALFLFRAILSVYRFYFERKRIIEFLAQVLESVISRHKSAY
jgi:hypothetical protein